MANIDVLALWVLTIGAVENVGKFDRNVEAGFERFCWTKACQCVGLFHSSLFIEFELLSFLYYQCCFYVFFSLNCALPSLLYFCLQFQTGLSLGLRLPKTWFSLSLATDVMVKHIVIHSIGWRSLQDSHENECHVGIFSSSTHGLLRYNLWHVSLTELLK